MDFWVSKIILWISIEVLFVTGSSFLRLYSLRYSLFQKVCARDCLNNRLNLLLFIGQKSDIQMRQRRRDALKEADVIILAGAVCDFRLSYGRTLGRKAKIIAINRNKEQLYKVCFAFKFNRVIYSMICILYLKER